MTDPDFSAIGADAPPAGKATDLAKREDLQFELDKLKEIHDHTRRVGDAEKGAVGRLFGSRDNAVTYLVLLIIVICIVILSIFAAIDASLRATAVEVMKAIIYAGVGVLTGKSLGQSDKST